MTETVIKKETEPEIDEDLLAEVQRHLGVADPADAINLALRELVQDRRARRRRGLERLQQMSDEGLFNYAALDEADR